MHWIEQSNSNGLLCSSSHQHIQCEHPPLCLSPQWRVHLPTASRAVFASSHSPWVSGEDIGSLYTLNPMTECHFLGALSAQLRSSICTQHVSGTEGRQIQLWSVRTIGCASARVLQCSSDACRPRAKLSVLCQTQCCDDATDTLKLNVAARCTVLSIG